MFAARRRLIVAGAVVAMVVGVLLQGGLSEIDGEPAAGGDRSSAAVVEWAPAGVMPVAVRARAWLDGDFVSVNRIAKAALAASVSPFVGALALWVVASWCVWRCDHRLGRGLPGSPLAALRAPPVS